MERAVQRIATEQDNVFISGPVGYGKTRFLKVHVLRRLRAAQMEGKVAVMATTRVAARRLGGCTFQKWAGIRFGEGTVGRLVAEMKPSARARIRETAVVVIDEVSLLNGQLSDKVDKVVRRVRGDERLFAGSVSS